MTSVPPPFEHPGPPPSRPELPEGAPVPETPPDDVLPPLGVPIWGPFLALLATFVGVIFAVIVLDVVVGIGGGDVAELDDSQGVTIALTVLQGAFFIGCSIAVVTMVGSRPTPAAFGLRRPALPSAVWWALGAYAAFWIAAIVITLAFGEPEEQDIVSDLKAEDSVAVLAGFGVLTCVIAPLTEEFFFRGFMFKAFSERMPVALATLVTAGTFGIVHLPGADPLGVLVLSLLGVALCLLFWYTKSLLPCIMLHAFHNSISFGATKELPLWGFLLLIVASVGATLAVSLLAMRLGRRSAAPVPS